MIWDLRRIGVVYTFRANGEIRIKNAFSYLVRKYLFEKFRSSCVDDLVKTCDVPWEKGAKQGVKKFQ